MDATTIVLAIAGVSGIYLAWNIGANDLANVVGPAVGSRALGLRAAVVLAAISEVSGALLAGPTVSETLATDVVVLDAMPSEPLVTALGLAGALLAAAIWVQLATHRGWPVSTTHSIVGALIGLGLAAGGPYGIDISNVGSIALTWIAAPFASAFLAYVLFIALRRNVLVVDRPVLALRTWAPVMVAPMFGLLALAIAWRVARLLDVPLDPWDHAAVALGVAALGALATASLVRRATRGAERSRHEEGLRRTERVLLVLQVPSACFLAFAHGSNDVGNTAGPLSAIFSTITDGTTATVVVPFKVVLVAAVAMAVGLATYGFRVIGTVRDKMSAPPASRGFTAEVSAGIVVLAASNVGMPVSVTHTLVAAVVGVGLARSLGALDSLVIRRVVLSWLATVPACALLSATLFYVGRAFL